MYLSLFNSTLDTKKFIKNLLEQCDPAYPTIVLTDGASIHTRDVVERERENWKKSSLIVVYLPPYSPELNLVKGEWRHLKYHDLQESHVESKENSRRAIGTQIRCRDMGLPTPSNYLEADSSWMNREFLSNRHGNFAVSIAFYCTHSQISTIPSSAHSSRMSVIMQML